MEENLDGNIFTIKEKKVANGTKWNIIKSFPFGMAPSKQTFNVYNQKFILYWGIWLDYLKFEKMKSLNSGFHNFSSDSWRRQTPFPIT